MYMRKINKSELKYKTIDSSKTELVNMKFGDTNIDVWVNPAVNIALSNTETIELYRLSKDKTTVSHKLGDYECIDLKIDGLGVKASRSKVVPHIMGTKTDKPKNFETLSKDCDFDAKKTKLININGEKYISNTGLNVIVNLMTAAVHNTTTSRKILSKSIYVKFVSEGRVVTGLTNVWRVITMMWGIDMPRYASIRLIDPSLGYTKENITVLTKSECMSEANPKGTKIGKTKSSLKETLNKCVSTFVTEDRMTFKSDVEANEHQIKVDHAKELANVVLSNLDNRGYAVAEQVFLKSLGVDKSTVNYKNFIEVINDNNGVQKIAKELVPVSIKLDDLYVQPQNRKDADLLISDIKSKITKLQTL